MTDIIKEYDFDSVVERLNTIIQSKETWKDMYQSTTGQVLIQLLGYAVDNLGYYLERRVQELYIGTAQLDSSVRHLASLLSYLPSRRIAATGTGTFTLTSALANQLIIPRGTEFEIEDLKYSNKEAIILNPGETEVTFNVIQGSLVDRNDVLTEDVDYLDMTEDFETIDDQNLMISVSDLSEDWEYEFNSSGRLAWRELDRYYTLRYYFGKLRIDFGKEPYGRNPFTDGAYLNIVYWITDGAVGNVYQAVTGLTFDNTIYDVLANEVSEYTIAVGTLLGASDEEGIESIRLYAPRIFATGMRAVTAEDYKYWIEKQPNVIKASVWGEQEEYEKYNRNTARFTFVGAGIQELSQTAVDNIIAAVDEYRTITVRMKYEEPDIKEIDLNIKIAVASGYGFSSVSNNMDTALKAYFDDDFFDFSKNVYISDFIREASKIEGVDGLEVTWTINDVILTEEKLVLTMKQIGRLGTITYEEY